MGYFKNHLSLMLTKKIFYGESLNGDLNPDPEHCFCVIFYQNNGYLDEIVDCWCKCLPLLGQQPGACTFTLVLALHSPLA